MSESVVEANQVYVPEWLVRTWRHHAKRAEYDLDMAHWLEEYPDLVKLIQISSGSIIDAWPSPGSTLEDGETPVAYTIRLKPRTQELLQAQFQQKPGPKTHRTQMTVDGKTYNTRNEGVEIALLATPSGINTAIELIVIQFEGEDPISPDGRRTRRALAKRMYTWLALRDDVRPDLQEKIRNLYAEAWPPEQAAQECVSKNPGSS